MSVREISDGEKFLDVNIQVEKYMVDNFCTHCQYFHTNPEEGFTKCCYCCDEAPELKAI